MQQPHTLNPRRPHAKAWLALVLATAMAVGLIFWGVSVIYKKRQEHYRHQAERELQAINYLQAESVSKWREQRLTDATALSDDALFAQATAQWRQAPSVARQAQVRERLRILQEHANYIAVYLVDAQGDLLLTPQGTATGHLPEPEQQALQEAFSTAQATVVEPRRDPFFSFPFFSLMAPVFDGSTPMGAVWLVSDVRSTLYPLLHTWPTPSETAESSIVSSSGDGKSAQLLSPLRQRTGSELSFSIPMAHQNDPAVQALAGTRGIFYGLDYRDSSVMAAVSAVPSSPWYLVSKIDEAEVFGATQVRELLALSLPISLGLLFAGLVFAAVQRRGRLREAALKTELQRNMRWLEGAQKAASIGYFAYERTPQFFTMSSMATEIFGVDTDNAMPLRQWIEMIHPEHRKAVLEEHHQAMTLRHPLSTQYRIRRANDQQTRWIQVWGEHEQNAQGSRFDRMIGTVQDITARKESEQALADYRAALEEKMRLDPLTNIANRRALDEHMATQWQRAMRNQRALSLLMIDVDHFKRYNDHYGHVEGDECLQRVARTLATLVTRADEMVARFGGEEFAVLLPDTEAPQALALANKMCAAISSLGIAHAASDTAPHVTVSIGVACIHPIFDAATGLRASKAAQPPGTALDAELAQALDGALAQALFEQADAALYSAKLQGRNRAILQPGIVPDAF